MQKFKKDEKTAFMQRDMKLKTKFLGDQAN